MTGIIDFQDAAREGSLHPRKSLSWGCLCLAATCEKVTVAEYSFNEAGIDCPEGVQDFSFHCLVEHPAAFNVVLVGQDRIRRSSAGPWRVRYECAPGC